MSDLVSVVIPVYNVEDYITNILDAVINQTYKNIELILVDDGSPDNSVKIAQDYLKNKELNWRFIHQENQGLSAARNKGISEAKGEWIICPDSDDYIAPQTIEKMLEAVKANNAKGCFCGYKPVEQSNVKQEVLKSGDVSVYSSGTMKKLFLNRKIVLLVTGMLLHKSLYDTLKYDINCPYDEDIHFLWQLLFLCDKVVRIDADYYNYLSRASSMVHTLTPQNYLMASASYAKMVEQLKHKYPDELDFINCIHPKYKLGGLHVLAKSTDYDGFKSAVVKDGYRKDIRVLFKYGDGRLKILTLIYLISLKSFYLICKRG